MQAILITSSLLLMAGMLGALAWLSVLRMRHHMEAVPVESSDDTV